MTIELTASVIVPTTILDTGAFTRSTTATYFDANGVMQTAPVDVPRIGYDPVTHAHTGLILEGAATNLLTYSEQFDNAAWAKARSTVTANVGSVTAPDGSNYADKLVEDTANNLHVAYQSCTVTSGQIYTFSIYLKAGERTKLFLNLSVAFPGASDVAFDLVAGNASGITNTINPVGNGWYRCSITATANATGAANVNLYCYTTAVSYTGDGTSGLYIWGAQLETGSVATSYIPTTSTQVTRAADVVTGSGLIYTDVPENDYAAWLGGTTYTALTDYVIRTTATTHKVYQCLVTHTTAATPEDNTTGVTPKWLEIGPTNRWGMFDRKVGTETTQATSMTYLLKPGRANSLGLLGIDADSELEGKDLVSPRVGTRQRGVLPSRVTGDSGHWRCVSTDVARSRPADDDDRSRSGHGRPSDTTPGLVLDSSEQDFTSYMHLAITRGWVTGQGSCGDSSAASHLASLPLTRGE